MWKSIDPGSTHKTPSAHYARRRWTPSAQAWAPSWLPNSAAFFLGNRKRNPPCLNRIVPLHRCFPKRIIFTQLRHFDQVLDTHCVSTAVQGGSASGGVPFYPPSIIVHLHLGRQRHKHALVHALRSALTIVIVPACGHPSIFALPFHLYCKLGVQNPASHFLP